MVSPACDDTLGRRIAAAIKEALERRAGDVLDAECIRDRSNNAACWVLEAIHDFNEESTAGCRNPGDINDSAGRTK